MRIFKDIQTLYEIATGGFGTSTIKFIARATREIEYGILVGTEAAKIVGATLIHGAKTLKDRINSPLVRYETNIYGSGRWEEQKQYDKTLKGGCAFMCGSEEENEC